MCGICGAVDYNRITDLCEDTLRRMNNALWHRGPDDEGIYFHRYPTSHIGLGHRRLKIIDLSSAGHQPMCNEDRSIWIVFNGEIYNYIELRKDLENKGHIFRSNTDTETAIHLYEEYGKECLKFLRGMFAFAIWDEKKGILLLGRDRVGKKPLLYSYNNGIFCFASEFLALLESGLIKNEINYGAIDYYLTFGYIPSPLSIYKDVFKLPPAHRLILEGGKIYIERYWQLDYLPKLSISEDDAAGEILRLVSEATKIRLYSDVPLGAFLSGGIDSSTVVALMSKLSEKKAKTFSIGFEDKDYDELKFARNIAKRFNTEHNEFIVKPNALEILPLLVERYGEPYADSSCIPTYYVARETRKYVTVALNGDGGDELFAGYERYQAMLAAENIPAFAKTLLGTLSGILPDSTNPKNKLRRIKRFFNGVSLPFQQRYLKWIGIFDGNLKNDLYSDDFLCLIADTDPLRFIDSFLDNSHKTSILDSLLRTDTMTYLPNDLLVKVDITSMANSLEARSPFLDHVLMEFVAKLPAGYKIKGFVKKYILKKAIKDLIPPENIHRKKMGFGVPVGEWFRGELRGFLQDTLLSQTSLGRGYFKPTVIKDMIQLHILRKADYTFQLWLLLMLELWHQRFID
jgi:asparagine synthase (glutamine-hydrolysing)